MRKVQQIDAAMNIVIRHEKDKQNSMGGKNP